MKIQLSDLRNYDEKEVIWVLGKTMTVVMIRIPEDQKNEIIPVFVVQKGLEGGLMRWENDISFFALDNADEAYDLWKKNTYEGGEKSEEEEQKEQKEEFNII